MLLTPAERDRLLLYTAAGLAALGPDDVLPGVAAVVTEVKVEAVFEDGTRLVVVVPHPVSPPPPPLPAARTGDHARHDHRSPDVVEVTVVNTAAVPISVSSHFHFFEANPRLRFDRGAAYGRHLAAAAGSTVRFDPGEEVTAGLVPIAGERVVSGTRSIGLADMRGGNDRRGEVRVDAAGSRVTLDGEELRMAPVSRVPLARLYHL